ncbi:MAG: SGNH/GDSL hydrolase family protein [Leptolyngbyaceae cyanobacterium]
MTVALPADVMPGSALALQPKRIVAVGDSLVYGYGDPEGGGWVERLRRQWLQPETPGHAIYNLGVRGDGVQRVAQRLGSEFRYRGELRNRLNSMLVMNASLMTSRSSVLSLLVVKILSSIPAFLRSPAVSARLRRRNNSIVATTTLAVLISATLSNAIVLNTSF